MLIIIGGDAAGMSAASRYKRRNPDGEMIVLEKTMDVSYSACSMPYNIGDADSLMDSLIVRKAEVFREKQGIDLRTGHEVTGIDREKKIVSGKKHDGSDFSLNYDELLIATGTQAVVPSIPGTDLPGVFTLKTLEDGRKIKDFLAGSTVKNCVIIGMGYIALEMAEALEKRGIGIRMVKKRPDLLPWMIPEQSSVVKDHLEEKGVELVTGQEILVIEESSHAPGGLKVKGNSAELTGEMVLVAMGVIPAAKIAGDAGLKLGPGGSIHVDNFMKTSDPSIWSAGDCADARDIVSGKDTWIPLALTANRGGRIAADNILGDAAEFKGIAGTSVFKVFDLEVARTGLSMEEAEAAGFDPVYADIISKSKAHTFADAERVHAALIGDKKTGRILGAQMVGKEGVARRINAAAVALQAGMTAEEFYACDLAYAPPFSPVWDPILMAAGNLIKKLQK
ncbi:MAG: FAD-dependent oxidoreductase [Spirochaetales bacterium]|nr:FAD-dependent oxidoreductase [Spirochaetales bacterium]